MKNRILRVAIAPNYRPSGSHDANVVYGGGGGYVRPSPPTHPIPTRPWWPFPR